MSEKYLGAALAASVALAAIEPAFAQAAPAGAPAAVAPATSNGAYVLGLGDTIEVTLLGNNDFTTRARVGSDGAILLPYVGATVAKDRSPIQLADQIRAALQAGGFYAQPVVRVEVITAASQYATVLGFVRQPGLVPLDRDYRLSEIIARVGGRIEGGAAYALLTSGAGGEPKRFEIASLATATADGDPQVQAGDKVYIPAVENEVFYVTGQVRTPGPQPSLTGLTLRMALARSGGVTEQGSEKKIKVVRAGATLRNVNLDKTIVQPGDIITVGQRLF